MASPATSTYLPALDVPHEREGVGEELQSTLHELVDLSLIGKQLHWAVVGPLFRPLHLQLDELVESWHELSDSVAERAVALGFVPDGQARAVVVGSELAPLARGSIEDHVVVRELTHRIAEVSERVRDQMNRLGDADLATQDVLIEVVRELEKQQWMLRAQLGERASLGLSNASFHVRSPTGAVRGGDLAIVPGPTEGHTSAKTRIHASCCGADTIPPVPRALITGIAGQDGGRAHRGAPRIIEVELWADQPQLAG